MMISIAGAAFAHGRAYAADFDVAGPSAKRKLLPKDTARHDAPLRLYRGVYLDA